MRRRCGPPCALNEEASTMLRNCVGALAAVVLVAGLAAADDKPEVKKGTFYGKILKYDAKNGTLTVIVKKKKNDEGTKTDYQLAADTKFMVAGGVGEKSTPLTTKEEIASKLKKGTMVRLTLDEDGKVARTVVIGRGPEKNEDNK
jgi:hypothetical protein